MVKVEMNGKEFYIDGLIQKNLDLAKKAIKKDWDFVYIVDGIEGGGKSILAQTLAYYVSDGTFNIKDIVFTVDEFEEKVRGAERYSAIVWDEAFRGLASGAALSKVNKRVKEILMECRQKNLFIFVVMPNFWQLDKYVVLHRARGCFHVYTDRSLQRGFFRYYRGASLVFLYKNRAKYYLDHPDRYKTYFGRFTNEQIVPSDEYKQKKSVSFMSDAYAAEAEVEDKKHMVSEYWRRATIELMEIIKQKYGVNYRDQCRMVGLDTKIVEVTRPIYKKVQQQAPC